MEKRKFVLFSVAVNLLVMHQGYCGSSDLTFSVGPGRIECFWHSIHEGAQVDLDYQVIDGGDVDIDFTVYAPDGSLLQHDERKTDGSATFTGQKGDYKFCFDNSFSHMTSKTVFFDISSDLDEEALADDWKFDMEEVKDMMDMSLEEVKGIIDRSRSHLDKSILLQTQMKMHEARDRNILEANLYRVNMFSAFQVCVMVTVSLTQVLMIRNLFEEKKYSRTGIRQST